MIGFFRRIRRKLANDNKPIKYARYAIGEIVLVVIGILIALGINNWNQGRIEIKKETIALSNLILDLEEQTDLLEVYIEEEKEFYESGLYLSEHYGKNKAFIINDSLLSKLNLLGFRRTFNPINTTFNELVSTGSIGLIRDEKLKRNIMQHYNEIERISLVTSNNNTNLVDGIYNPVLFELSLFIFKFNYKEGQFNQLLNDTKNYQNRIFNAETLKELYSASGKLLKTPEKALNLFNVVQIRTQMASGQIIRYTKLQQEITELINSIKLELKK